MHPRSFSKSLIPDYNAAEFDKEYSGFACSLHVKKLYDGCAEGRQRESGKILRLMLPIPIENAAAAQHVQ
jgi:hypothetical protein